MTEPPLPEQAPAPPGSPRRRWAVWLGIILLLALVMGVSVPRVKRHFTTDPQLCSSCHVDAGRDAHAANAHKKLPCQACHESRLGQNLRQWALSSIGAGKTPHGASDPARCSSCHMKGDGNSWAVAASTGHREHSLGKKPVPCAKCHVYAKHSLRLDRDLCQSCHKEAKVYDHDPKRIDCAACHSFVARTRGEPQSPIYACQRCHGGPAQVRLTAEITQVVPGKAVTADMIHGKLQSCGLCHRPHEADPKLRLLGQDCTRCHNVVEQHHHDALPDKATCTICHAPHGERSQLTASCSACHTQGKGADRVLIDQHKSCTSCHKPHVFSATRTICAGCHDKEADRVASWAAVKHSDCLNCHRPHGTSSNLARCDECHQGKQNNMHPACITCHEPHSDRSHARPCAGCHGGQVLALSTGPVAHSQKCSSCHETHAPAGAPKLCASCHTQIAAAVARAPNPRHQTCISCHAPHRFTPDVTACNDCHHLPVSNLHAGDCRQCHTPHGDPLGKAAHCSNCHADKPTRTGPHSQCTNCHAPHGASRELPKCTQCHASEVAAAMAWRPPAHQNCAGCHQKTHDPRIPACKQCHASEVSTNVGSSHKCSSCHQVHQAPPASFWLRCNSCHSDIVTATAQRGPTHSTCKSCHKPHQPVRPACQSCHTELPAAHNFSGHKVCSKCHETHAPSHRTRATCLSCHKDKEQHQPQAQDCAACHIFGRI